jgi:glycosyltransferase involved in cell wall biosynthesis
MKILWIINLILPQIALDLGLKKPVYGGWLEGLSRQLLKSQFIDLHVIFPHEGNKLIKGQINGLKYYGVPLNYRIQNEIFISLNNLIKPDLVHIHGTEYNFGNEYIKSNNIKKYLVSIQGLISIYSRYYYAGLNVFQLIKNMTLRDVLRMDTIFQQKMKFEKRGKREINLLKRSNHIIGRTDWDRAHVVALNKNTSYYHCDEILRDSFYDQKNIWKYSNFKKHTIYISQGNYPIKGLHKVLHSISLLIDEFPNINLRIGGYDITRNKNKFTDKLRISGYGKIIREILLSNKISNNVTFLGEINELQVVDELKNCNVFICASAVENSPNAFCEAQILGVPTIATFCGGLPSLIKDYKSTILVNFNEQEMLAMYIRNIFNDQQLCEELSLRARNEATIRHNRDLIGNKMQEIYNYICSSDQI